MTGAASEIDFVGSNTFDNATLNIGNAGGAFLTLVDAGSGSELTIGTNATVNHVNGGAAYLGAGVGLITNLGTIEAAASGSLTISSGDFTNSGTISVANGDTVVVEPVNPGGFTNFSGGDLTGGTYEVSNGTLEFAGADVTQLDATLILGGSYSFANINDGQGNTIEDTLTAIGAGAH